MKEVMDTKEVQMPRSTTELPPPYRTSTCVPIVDGQLDLEVDNVVPYLPWKDTPNVVAEQRQPAIEDKLDIVPAPLNIVMHVVGSYGDVQPFIVLAKELQKFNHCIRIATHTTFGELVQSHGIGFFDIGGDPHELMAYMVENPSLVPKVKTVQNGELSHRRQDLRNMIAAFWKSCIEPDQVQHGRSFVADAIIANPPSFAHIHCAEKLGIPLHMVFTMPWTPTSSFPHPLANLAGSNGTMDTANAVSYPLVDSVLWQGIGSILNEFRVSTLRLDPLNQSQYTSFFGRLNVPFTYVWSPSLLPKPLEWPANVKVSGYLSLPASSAYQPPDNLLDFIQSGSPPVYIGFGSIVVGDPTAFTALILQAIEMAGVRAVLYMGWAQLAMIERQCSKNVFVLNQSCPHSWLFNKVAAVVHHGGAGTTAAGLLAGKPTLVVPFFGDQHFWGRMVHRTGAGVLPLPAKSLTVEALSNGIQCILSDPSFRRRAEGIGQHMKNERGPASAAQHFHECLPASMFNRCASGLSKTAVFKLKRSANRKAGHEQNQSNYLSLSAAVAASLLQLHEIEPSQVSPIRHLEYDLTSLTYSDPLSGASLALGSFFSDTFYGMGEILYEIIAQPVSGSRQVWEATVQKSSSRALVYRQESCDAAIHPTSRTLPGAHAFKGTLKLGRAAIRLPGQFTLAMARGAHAMPMLWNDHTVRSQPRVSGIRSGLKAGAYEFAYQVSDGISGLVLQPVFGVMEATARNKGAGSVKTVAVASVGIAKGVGKAVLGLPVKWFAAASATVGYPLAGVEAEIRRFVRRKLEQQLTATLIAERIREGEYELCASEGKDVAVVQAWWREINHGKS